MREGWTYKKLGEIYDVRDGTHDSPSYYSEGFPLVTSKNLRNGIIDMSNINYISEQDYRKINARSKVDVGDVLFAMIGTIGNPVLVTEEPNYAIKNMALFKVPKEQCGKFLFYYLSSKVTLDKMKTDVRGGTQRFVSLNYLRNFVIKLPKNEDQIKIVVELDLLSSIIEKKKAQLKEYDQLAQSIFYDMFGDPVTNEKGWEVKKLNKVSTLINGRAYKQDELLNEGKYKVLRVGNFFTNSNYYYSDLELEDNKYCDYGDLLFAWSASFGAFIWNGEKVIYHYHIWKVLFDEQQLNKVFYCYLLNIMTKFFMNDVHGIGMVHLTKQGMEQYDLPLPPLHLQQSFASNIEAIEQQKALIQQSITETETLFNSRMDYYFN